MPAFMALVQFLNDLAVPGQIRLAYSHGPAILFAFLNVPESTLNKL